MHPKAVIRKPHWNLLGLDATFPIATDDPRGDAIGQLDLGDRLIHEITVIPKREFMQEATPEMIAEFYPMACAILDFKKGVVYTFNMATEHSRLIAAFGIVPGTNQTNLEDDLICGFVTASGHFFNRESMQYFVEKHHPQFKKKSSEEYFFNSSMVNWKVVMDHIHERATAD